ncbi:MAG: ATP-binding cassette domain-containing protein [Armatimonadetes bacterium]|nr:ATP-binding cassette domain-containing protein [Armatimonadota bacterium]
MIAIDVADLVKTFDVTERRDGALGGLLGLFAPKRKRVEAVRGVTFSIPRGQIVGFLGPNGAGKTTTLKILSGILRATSGKVSVLGYSPFDRDHRMLRRIALVMGNKQQLWWDLPAMDSFEVLREIYGVPNSEYQARLDLLVNLMQLEGEVNTQVRRLSLGERMKCELVASLLHGPEVLFLDEPTIGLDVVSQRRIRGFLRQYNEQTGCTIVLTSHYMADVQALAERLIVIDKGALVFDGTSEELAGRYSNRRILRLTFESTAVPPSLGEFGQIVSQEGSSISLSVDRAKAPETVSRILQQHTVRDIAIDDISLDEVIHDLFTGRE